MQNLRPPSPLPECCPKPVEFTNEYQVRRTNLIRDYTAIKDRWKEQTEKLSEATIFMADRCSWLRERQIAQINLLQTKGEPKAQAELVATEKKLKEIANWAARSFDYLRCKQKEIERIVQVLEGKNLEEKLLAKLEKDLLRQRMEVSSKALEISLDRELFSLGEV